MKLSCTPISFHAAFRQQTIDFSGFLRFCAGEGLEGIDLLDTEGYPWFWSGAGTLRDGADRVRREGLAIAAYALGNNFAKSKPEDRAEQVALAIRGIDRAAECGAPVMRIFGGAHAEAGGEPGMETRRGVELVVECLEQCLPHAEKRGIVLALENHGRLPGHSFEQAAVINYFSSPWLKALYDPANYLGNQMGEDEDPLRAYEALKGNIVHVHLKDVGPPVRDLTRRREPYVAGKGLTPLRQIVAALVRDGYAGYAALEYEASHVVPEEEGVPVSLAFLKQCRDAAQVQTGKLRTPIPA